MPLKVDYFNSLIFKKIDFAYSEVNAPLGNSSRRLGGQNIFFCWGGKGIVVYYDVHDIWVLRGYLFALFLWSLNSGRYSLFLLNLRISRKSFLLSPSGLYNIPWVFSTVRVFLFLFNYWVIEPWRSLKASSVWIFHKIRVKFLIILANNWNFESDFCNLV